LGDGTFVSKSSPIQTIASGNNWKQVSCGNQGHTAAIKSDGTLWLWGYNFYGQLGTSTTTLSSSPVQTIAGGNNWKQVSCGVRQAYNISAIKTDGTLWCCGYNGAGQLGDEIINIRFTKKLSALGINYVWLTMTSRKGLVDIYRDNNINAVCSISDVPKEFLASAVFIPGMQLPIALNSQTQDLWKGPYLTKINPIFDEKWKNILTSTNKK
jgi:hypothetical protein